MPDKQEDTRWPRSEVESVEIGYLARRLPPVERLTILQLKYKPPKTKRWLQMTALGPAAWLIKLSESMECSRLHETHLRGSGFQYLESQLVLCLVEATHCSCTPNTRSQSRPLHCWKFFPGHATSAVTKISPACSIMLLCFPIPTV